jgi:type VI secretion system protein ImpH
MQQLLGDEYEWDALLILHKQAVPATDLGKQSRLGWTSWLGNKPRHQHADDVYVPS